MGLLPAEKCEFIVGQAKTVGGHFYQQHGRRDLNAFIEALELDNIVLGFWEASEGFNAELMTFLEGAG